RLGHEQIAVPDRGQRAAPGRAAVHRHAFAYDIAPADHEARLLALKLQVLRRLADRSERVDLRALADLAGALDDDVSGDLHFIVNANLIAYDRIRADRDVCAQSRA